MGVFAHVHWPANALLVPPVHYRLGNGQDVVAVETAVKRRAAVAGRAEGDSFSGVLGIGGVFFVGCQYFIHSLGGFLFLATDTHGRSRTKRAVTGNTAYSTILLIVALGKVKFISKPVLWPVAFR